MDVFLQLCFRIMNRIILGGFASAGILHKDLMKSPDGRTGRRRFSGYFFGNLILPEIVADTKKEESTSLFGGGLLFYLCISFRRSLVTVPNGGVIF